MAKTISVSIWIVAAAVRRARAAGGVYGDVEATGVLEERSERRVEELNE